MSSLPTWGVVATIKAPTRDILNFAAHHLDLGAHRVHVYLDEDDEPARHALKAHPKCRVILCDDGYWKRRQRRKGRPATHQPRQSINATHCLRRRADVDWLAHIDVDEFLLPDRPVPEVLATLPPDTISARVRPFEALAPDPDDPPPPGTQWFKSCALAARARSDQTRAIYPTYGDHLNGGFLSHTAGKVFVRTGRDDLSMRIHNAFIDGVQDPASVEMPPINLCHLHAPGFDHWHRHYRFRLEQGSYRPALKPAPGSATKGMNMHALLSLLDDEGGTETLRAFYTQVNMATPDLRARLQKHDQLHQVALNLDEKRLRHFPNAA